MHEVIKRLRSRELGIHEALLSYIEHPNPAVDLFLAHISACLLDENPRRDQFYEMTRMCNEAHRFRVAHPCIWAATDGIKDQLEQVLVNFPAAIEAVRSNSASLAYERVLGIWHFCTYGLPVTGTSNHRAPELADAYKTSFVVSHGYQLSICLQRNSGSFNVRWAYMDKMADQLAIFLEDQLSYRGAMLNVLQGRKQELELDQAVAEKQIMEMKEWFFEELSL